MTERRHHRPAMPGAGHFEAIETTAHGADPAVLAEAAERAATALVRGARDQADSELVSRVVHLADTEGLETLADLWAGAAPDSLAGSLWRLYVLRSWVYADPQTAAREYDRGRAQAETDSGSSYDNDLAAAKLLTLAEQLQRAARLELDGSLR